ncbi:AMP-binding protein [Azospirillum sp.]|uniref:AMP-binding protein n=1 Tax=Azospirillum sp. TaxID=34012 RepID=UPI003D729C9D
MNYLDLFPSKSSTVHAVLEQRARRLPDHPFLMVRDRVLTYADLNDGANRLAHGLIARGVRPGDRVAVMMTGSVSYVLAWFAIAKAGAVEVPVNTAYKGELLRYILKTADVAAVIADEAFVAELRAAGVGLPGLGGLIVNPADGGAGPGTLNGTMAVERHDPDLPVSGGDPACVIFTSGTTGPSKGVVITHHHEVSFGVFFDEIVSMRGDDVAYNYLPFFHIAAKFLTLGAMLVDGRMALEPVFSLSRFWDDVWRYSATVVVAVGGLCHMLRSLPARPDDADNTLRLVYAVPVPAEFQEEFERRFGVTLVEGYGSTESNLIVYSRPGETPRGSCGRPSPHFEVAILDEDGHRLGPGESGEICVRPTLPNTLMKEYLGMPGKTLEAMQGYWFHTGDRGVIDEAGFVYFQDRIKDSIRRRGENISSFEVERLLNAHPDVAESAVVAIPSEVGEDEVKAVVVRRPGSALDGEALLRFAAETMPYFMVPRYIAFRDSLPRTPTQKVRKVDLRREGVTDDTWDRERAGLRVTRDGLRDTRVA